MKNILRKFQGFGEGPVFHSLQPVFNVREEQAERKHRPTTKSIK